MRLRRTLAILFLGQSLLFGAVYSSNALMQTLEILPQAPSEGYYIITDGSTDTLYLDGESVCTLTRSGDTEIRSDASGVTTRVFDGDRLVSVTGPDGEEKRYEYSDDGILERVTTYSDGQAVRVIQYSYTPQTGLSAVIDLSDASASFYSGTEMTYRDGETVRVVDSLRLQDGMRAGLIPETEGSIFSSEDGHTVTEPWEGNVRVSVYDAAWKLTEQRIEDSSGNVLSSSEYTYDENGNRASLTEISADERRVMKYTDGVLSSMEVYRADELAGSYDYSGPEIRETRYRNGRPWAEVTYDSDGIRVLDVRML